MSPYFSLVPHAVCWASSPRLIWTMVVTNLITFLSYVSICVTLLFLVRRTRHVINREWGFFVVGFAAFIVACGSTHLLEVITTWIPIFWVDATTNIITAVLSATVAILLIRRALVIGFSINDYAERLANTEGERLRLQQSLLAARKLEEMSRMSAVISHEIGNPLEAVQNLLYLIRTTEGVSPEVVQMASTAAEEATRVLTISRSTLSVFRNQSQAEQVDLLLAAESVRFLLATQARDRGIGIRIHSTGSVMVESFAGEVRQILLNLVRNACEATERPNAEVEITLTGEPEGVRVVVRDQGTGIPASVLATLFEFGHSTKGSAGNGMGLWTVAQLLSRHGGSIQVSSGQGADEGSGTAFTLWWPRQYGTTPAQPSLDSASA